MHQEVEIENTIKLVRLETGEDLITDLLHHSDSSCYKFINPLRVVYAMSSNQNRLVITLVQWVFDNICSEQEFDIKKKNVLFVAQPTDDMIEYYYEAVTRSDQVNSKITKVAKSEIEDDSMSDISDSDLEAIKDILENVGTNKRTLH